MKGYPKFQYEEKVQFQFEDKIKEGTIYIIDKYGTFDNPSDVSYDIMSTTDDGRECLYKHITEKFISKL